MSAVGSIVGGVIANRDAKSGANNIKRVGEAEAEDRRRQSRRLLASQHAAFAKAGIAAGTGTALDVLGDTVAEGELDALRVRFARDTQAERLKTEGQAALVSGVASGVGSILAGAATMGLGAA
jgi:hypothetical protein